MIPLNNIHIEPPGLPSRLALAVSDGLVLDSEGVWHSLAECVVRRRTELPAPPGAKVPWVWRSEDGAVHIEWCPVHVLSVEQGDGVEAWYWAPDRGWLRTPGWITPEHTQSQTADVVIEHSQIPPAFREALLLEPGRTLNAASKSEGWSK